ncbi:MAG TPA: glycoside hydrolase family 3 N-terminal domain-containing protein [Chitinophagaceae bacterium]|nr:glycoside hydrolase family 3 N-terminal domain-containing protein [Chitinophagaceae bacterium]
MKSLNYLLAFFVSMIAAFSLTAQQPDYKNPALSVEKRVADLLKRMTLEEKVAQVRSLWAGRIIFNKQKFQLNEKLLNDPERMDSIFKYGMGMMNPDFGATMEQTIARRNALQHYLKSKTRLGIPIIYIDEAHHGLLAPQVDVFPTSIGFSCSWDTALVTKVYTAIARQANSRGTHLVLSPVIDVVRDPRWGRTGETWGEDPYLSGVMGAAVVKGYQGSSNGLIAPGHVAATLKHFSGHGESEGGNNQGPANYSERVLREFHMEPFRLCIQRSKPAAIMASYCEIDGIPSHANKWLLTDVLRKEWNYKGIVVSDWFAIEQLFNKHFVEPDQKSAALRAFNAGVTSDLPEGVNFPYLAELVKEKKVAIADLDRAVSYVLALKFQMGLFEQGDADPDQAKAFNASLERRPLALKAAEESMVLLKNQNNLLPLNKNNYKKIAVIGPCAAVNFLGDYSGIPIKNVSILEGIRNKAGGQCEILYAKGCMLSKNGDTVSYNNYQLTGLIQRPSVEENRKLIEEAVAVARQADIVIVAVGENEQFSRESGMPDRFGDISDLDLQSQQDDLVKAIVATGKPVVTYLMHARPQSVNWIAENVPAIVDGWFTGEEAGNAFANILFGDVNPSGKLTISVPRSVGQLPMYYNHKPSAQYFEYALEKNTPLFSFGHGLSYTTYSYSAPRLSDTVIKKDGKLIVEVDVTNTGNRNGDEIVQLYIHQKVSSASRPVKELKDFARITLAAGEKKTVRFIVDATKLSYWDAAMKYGVEPGMFEIMTGASSVSLKKANLWVK